MTSKIFGQFTCWNPWVSIFFTFSGAPKPHKKLGDDKKLCDKKIGDALYFKGATRPTNHFRRKSLLEYFKRIVSAETS